MDIENGNLSNVYRRHCSISFMLISVHKKDPRLKSYISHSTKKMQSPYTKSIYCIYKVHPKFIAYTTSSAWNGGAFHEIPLHFYTRLDYLNQLIN